jgi:hypothetical protein
VISTSVKLSKDGHPKALVTMEHSDGLVLSPAQGCFHCCNQTAPAPAPVAAVYLFEVANHMGVWLPVCTQYFVT